MTEPRRPDAEVRLHAQREFRVPLLVEAGAGTGKTSILVARIVAWSLGPGWERSEAALREQGLSPEPDRVAARTLSRVVAITFTEAAAAEMAQRVGQWLGDVAAGDDPAPIAPEVLAAVPERRARAQALRSALDRLVVRTIHAFCRRLLAESPLEAGLHPAFEVDADEERTAQVVREVMEHAIPAAYAEPGSPLRRLAEQGEDPEAIEQALLAFVLAGVPAACLRSDPFAPARVERFVASLRAPVERFAEIEAERLVVSGRNHEAALEAVRTTARLLAKPPADAGALCEALRDAWPEAALKQLGAKWARGDFSKPGKAALGDDAEALAEPCAALHARLKHAVEVDPERLDLARTALAPLVEEVEARLRASGVETFAALLRDARALVEGRPGSAARIRRGIDQLLVDEFQDTDDVQCAIVAALALDGEVEERPGLFLVGDPRQSIYGWRSADLRAYDAFVARIEAAGGERLYLSRNFRSLPEVLAEVERCVAPVMQPEPGVQPPFQVLEADRSGPGEVEHWIPWGWDEVASAPARTRAGDAAAIEARALAEDVARLHREGVAWNEVAVLFRGMTQVDGTLDAFRDAGVPYTVERDRRYYQRREVMEASALVRAVLDPHDHVALLAWLRSAAVGVPDAAWIPLWTRGFPGLASRLQAFDAEGLSERLADVHACIDAAAAAVAPDVPGLDRVRGWEAILRQAMGTLAALRQALYGEPSDRFVEQLRTTTLIEVTEASRYLGPYRVANLDQFFRDLRDDLEETGGDVSEVLRRVRVAVENQAEVEEARPREAADDAVRVMSIHKAKGLDFGHVYLMQLHKGPGGFPEATRLGRGEQAEEFRLLGAPTLGFGEADEQSKRVEWAERVRTLYVGMTRARDRLVLVGKHPLQRPGASDGVRDSHAALLAGRRGAEEDPAARMATLARAGDAAVRDGDGVLWRFPALAPAEAETVTPPEARALPTPAAVTRASRRLAERRGEAEARMARPRSQAASNRSHEAVRERLQARHFPVEGEPVPRVARDADRAAAIGTAVHAALEHWGADPASAEAIAAARDVARAALAGRVPESQRAEAVAALDGLLERFVASPLFARFAALGDRVVARELPVLLPPGGEDEALGHVVGAVDLLYRDEAGAWVVADYKSDDVRTPDEAAERGRRYAAQGEVYVRAVRDALGLAETPRFELWFLASGECVEVTPPTVG